MKYQQDSYMKCETCTCKPRNSEECITVRSQEGLTQDENGCGVMEGNV